MTEPAEPQEGLSKTAPNSESKEEMADRLRRLEQAVSAMQSQTGANGVYPNGLAAGDSSGLGGLVQSAFMSALVPAANIDAPSRFWSRFALLREIRFIFRMYVDPRYRLSRPAQFGVPIILGLFVLNYLTFAFAWPVPIMAPILERVFIAVLAISLYKILSREAARYDAVLQYLAHFHR